MTMPMPPQQGSAPAQPIEIKLNTQGNQLRVLGGGIVCLLLGGAALVASIMNGAEAVPIVLGSVFALLGILLLVAYFGVMRAPRTLVVEPQGLRYVCKVGQPWAVSWEEIAACEITFAFHRGVNVVDMKNYRSRLILQPASPDFAQRHPEMATYANNFGGENGGYGFPLGPDRSLIDPLAQALAAYAGPRFRGVRDEGQVIGFGYV